MNEYLPPSPYKRLKNYSAADAENFFGRQKEVDDLSKLVANQKLTVLLGASGTGKTSLLLAGLEPMLARQTNPDYRMIYCRTFKDPMGIIKKGVQALLPANMGEDAYSPQHRFQIALLDLMITHFDVEEFEDLCFRLHVDADDLDGQSKSKKMRQLIRHCERRNRLEDLVYICQKQRPMADWPSPLLAFLQGAIHVLGGHLVIVLDQFEEFFRHLSQLERQIFLRELAVIYKAEKLPVHIVFCLVEERLADLSEVKAQIDAVYDHMLRLEFFSREQAFEAITKPIASLSVSYEPELVERLLKDLIVDKGVSNDSPKVIMPPQLQLVCHVLYSEVRSKLNGHSGEANIGLVDYDHLGGAEGILSHYLEAELSRLTAEERRLAKLLLEYFVTNKVATMPELKADLGESETAVTQVLDKLVDAYLMRRLYIEETITYELIHDYLALTPEMQLRKAVEELIAQALRDWHQFGTVIDAHRLGIVLEWRDRLNLNQEAHDLIDASLERRALEEEAQLAQLTATKMVALGQFISGVAHEINTPVGSIDANSKMIKEIIEETKQAYDQLPNIVQQFYETDNLRARAKAKGHELTPESVQLIQDIAEQQVEAIRLFYEGDVDMEMNFEDLVEISTEFNIAAGRITQMVRNLADFTRINEAENRAMDIHEGLESTLSLLHHELKYRVIIHRNYDGTLPEIVCFPDQLNQVFMNILMNAVHALELDKKDTDYKGNITIETYPEGKWAVIAITDDGKGMSDAVMAKIFDPHFSTKRAAAASGGLGLGLGLAISQKIVVGKHGGKIEVTSKLGEGTTFFIYLPLIRSTVGLA